MDVVSQARLGIAILKQEHDIIIVGGGLVGTTLACALAQESPFSIAVLEAQPTKATSFSFRQYSPRTSAINLASQRLFASLHVWEAMKKMRVSPFTKMHVWEEGGDSGLYFDACTIAASTLGHIVENQVIQTALLEKANASSQITLLSSVQLLALAICKNHIELKTKAHGTFVGKLAIAADGGRSWLREQMGLPIHKQDYQQIAIVATVYAELPHQQVARQVFLRTGTLAFLPLAHKNANSIVWSVPVGVAEQLMALDDEAFKQHLFRAFGACLGKIENVEQRLSFPLLRQHATRYVMPSIALVGDAAHTVHPLAGLGLNMGLLDAAGLVDVILDANKDGQPLLEWAYLRRYERWRKADNLLLEFGIDGIKRLFSAHGPLVPTLRRLGLSQVNQTQSLKNMFMRYAIGNRSGLPRLAQLPYTA